VLGHGRLKVVKVLTDLAHARTYRLCNGLRPNMLAERGMHAQHSRLLPLLSRNNHRAYTYTVLRPQKKRYNVYLLGLFKGFDNDTTFGRNK
jgi:hypothetical protein